MPTHNPRNERIKRQYFAYLKEAKRHSETTVDAVAKALARFEAATHYRDFGSFHIQQAIAFKKRLTTEDSRVTRGKLSKATLYATLAHLKRFFQWLAGQPGCKSRLQYCDAEYFNLSEKDARVATARREKAFPTMEQVKHVIVRMPDHSEIERRNRALVAMTLLTGARDSALASMRLKHIDLSANCVHQDAREVRTKFSKTFTTFFFPVGEEIRLIVAKWVIYLREVRLWGNDDPLFPTTDIAPGPTRWFEPAGLKRECDFSKAKKGPVVPMPRGKSRITIRLDDEVLEWFREQVDKEGGGNYQTRINEALRQHIERVREPLEDTLRRVIREEIRRTG